MTAARASVYDPPSYEEAMLMDSSTQDDPAEQGDSGSDEEADDTFQRELQSKVGARCPSHVAMRSTARVGGRLVGRQPLNTRAQRACLPGRRLTGRMFSSHGCVCRSPTCTLADTPTSSRRRKRGSRRPPVAPRPTPPARATATLENCTPSCDGSSSQHHQTIIIIESE